jgi:uncharacterized membrane protein
MVLPDELEHHPFRWTPDGAETFFMVGYDCLSTHSFGAMAVSDDGVVMAGWALACSGFHWSEATGWTMLGTLPGCGPYSLPRDVSGDGLVIVGGCFQVASLTLSLAFRWTLSEGMTALDDLPGGELNSVAYGASYDGSVIVGGSNSANNSSPTATEALLWRIGTGVTALGDLPGGAFDSLATAVSADGAAIVGRAADGSGRQAFLWTFESGLRNLRNVLVDDYGLGVPLEGWILEEAVGVAADGRTIAGNGINPDGFREGWIASLGPPCRADFNNDDTLNSQDFFDFLLCFFDPLACPPLAADFNADGVVTSDDFFDFLAAFFAGCP